LVIPSPAPSHDCFAAAAPGLERLCAQELAALGLAGRPIEGGVAFKATTRDLYRANLHLRTASRVLLRLGSFHAAAFAELRKKAARLPWRDYVAPGQPVTVQAASHKSKLYHSSAVAERVHGAIGDSLGRAVEQRAAPTDEDTEREPAQLVMVRLVRDMCTLSLDTSGALLHRRGYRLAAARAPLRETLAAGMLLKTAWDTTRPLLDPFCGAGTIAIEAALLALGIAPGHARRFAFMDWPAFDQALWRSVLDDAGAAWRQAQPVILASDRDAGAIEAAVANAERAGVAAHIQLSRRAVSGIQTPPGPGWVVTNPPYGLRVSGQRDLRNLYAQLGNVLREQCPGWQVAMLVADQRLAAHTGLRFDKGRSLSLVNGGLRVSLEQARVPPGGERPGGA
jgi:putative N6-adenine-specific DNA methylase